MNKKKAFIPMSVLIGALLLALVAAMTPFVAEPDVAYAQTPSADATLSALTVVGAPTTATTPPTGVTYSTLAPDLDVTPADGLTREYKVRIPFDQTGVVVTPTAAETDSIIRVNGTVVASAASHSVSVASAIGSEFTVTIHVQAPLRSSTQTYTVKVYRERQQRSDNKNLASLGVSGAGLSPAFTPGKLDYKARIQSDKVTVSYRLSDTGGAASVGTITASAGSVAGKVVTLGTEGTTTTITVPVTAEDGTSQDYTIAVYRIRANRLTDANLATLTLTPVGGTQVGTALALDTTHTDGTTTDYKDRMDNPTTHVTVAATVVDPGATFAISPSDANAGTEGHQVALTAGRETTITITVTAEDTARRQIYTVKVYRERATKSNDRNLNSLSLSAGTLTPAFARDKNSYTAQVAHDVEKVTVSYAASDTAGGSSVAVASTTVSGNEVTLDAAGTTTAITVTVTPECGASIVAADPSTSPPTPACGGDNAYTISVYRLRELPSANASLSGLTVAPGTLTPAFDAAATTRMYTVNVANNVASITVTPSAAGASAGATIVTTPKGGVGVDLTAGMETLITITVTAEDRATTDTYTVKVYRQRATRSDDATLSALSLSAGMLSPAFMSDITEYKARVASSVNEVTVSSTANDNAGGVGIALTTSGENDICDSGDTAVTTAAITLNGEGNNTNICVNVTAEDTTTSKSYLVQVYRLRTNPSVDDGLSTFTIAEATGSINVSDGTTTNPTGTLDLKAMNAPDVPYRVRQVTVVAMGDAGAVVTILPADADTTRMGHQVALSAGAETTITVLVQPEDSSVPSKAHTANVYRKNIPGTESTDNTLSSLMLSGAVLSPTFAPATTKYTAMAANSTELTTVTAMATHIGAQSNVTITPPDANADMDGHQVRLTAGQEIAIMVSVRSEKAGPASTTMKTYTVTVTRAAEESSDATLESLTLSDLTLMPEFDPATTAYTAEIDFLETTTVEAMAAHHAATVSSGTGEKTLVVGDNMISVMVTAEDGSTQTYTVTVTVRRGETLLQRYDENNNGRIDLAEARMAVDDYLFNDVLTKEQAQEVVNLYLFG